MSRSGTRLLTFLRMRSASRLVSGKYDFPPARMASSEGTAVPSPRTRPLSFRETAMRRQGSTPCLSPAPVKSGRPAASAAGGMSEARRRRAPAPVRAFSVICCLFCGIYTYFFSENRLFCVYE